MIGVHPDWENFRQYIGRFKDSPYVKGVRRSFSKPEQCLEDTFIAGVRHLGELGMSFDLCGPPTGLAAAAKLVDRCSDTRFVLDHCGNISPGDTVSVEIVRGTQRLTLEVTLGTRPSDL